MMRKKSNSRRNFLKYAAISPLATVALPDLHSFNNINDKPIPEELTILFQGDSITDAGRDRENHSPNSAQGLGSGYAFQVVTHLLGNQPDKDINCYNRGISGFKVHQMAERWEEDCLQLKPNVLSILIGVNDFWHTLSHGYDGTAKVYETDLRKLLDRTRKKLPDVKLILGEPFAVKGGTAINEQWFPAFEAYQQAYQQIAKDYNAVFIPYQQIFEDALNIAPASYWCPDGVHPSIAGAYLMKEAWLKAFTNLWA